MTCLQFMHVSQQMLGVVARGASHPAGKKTAGSDLIHCRLCTQPLYTYVNFEYIITPLNSISLSTCELGVTSYTVCIVF